LIPLYNPAGVGWYLELLRQDGRCSVGFTDWSLALYEYGYPYTERRNWAEWKTIMLETMPDRWKEKTWLLRETQMRRELDVDLGERETWKVWHHRAHRAESSKRRKGLWRSLGEKLKEYGFPDELPGQSYSPLDEDPNIARFESLLIASPEAIEEIKAWIDSRSEADVEKIKQLGSKFILLYDSFSEKEINIELQSHLHVKTCPYCNSQYLETRTDYRTGRVYAGMQLDHRLPKEHYPLLALSLYNLVPTCGFCNHIKHSKSLTVSVYDPNYREDDIRFRYELKSGFLDPVRKDWAIRLYLDGVAGRSLAAKLIEDKKDILRLGMEDTHRARDRIIYCQGEEEAKAFLQLIQRHQKEAMKLFYVEENKNSDPALSAKEWYAKCLGLEENHLAHPFSKLKEDILAQYLEESGEDHV